MSEQARDFPTIVPPPKSVDIDPGRWFFPGRVDTHLYGSPAIGDSGVGAGAGGLGHRGAWSGSGGILDRGNGQTPEWYRRLAVTASAGSLVILFVLILVVR